jgi:CRISPR-associated protein Cas5t
MTVTAFDLPPARIALGADPNHPRGPHPTVHSLFQQLHNYPVGASGKARKEDAKGNKYNITPVRREFLADLRAIVIFDFLDRSDIEEDIRQALSPNPPPGSGRYGLPFLGDNAFLLDKIEVCDDARPAIWYERLSATTDDPAEIRRTVPLSTRLTCWIDRQDMSKTRSELYAPLTTSPTAQPPPAAWTSIEPPAAPKAAAKPAKKKG